MHAWLSQILANACTTTVLFDRRPLAANLSNRSIYLSNPSIPHVQWRASPPPPACAVFDDYTDSRATS